VGTLVIYKKGPPQLPPATHPLGGHLDEAAQDPARGGMEGPVQGHQGQDGDPPGLDTVDGRGTVLITVFQFSVRFEGSCLFSCVVLGILKSNV